VLLGQGDIAAARTDLATPFLTEGALDIAHAGHVVKQTVNGLQLQIVMTGDFTDQRVTVMPLTVGQNFGYLAACIGHSTWLVKIKFFIRTQKDHLPTSAALDRAAAVIPQHEWVRCAVRRATWR